MLDDASLAIANTKGICGIYREDTTKTYAAKTRADILSDLSCIRAGDRIFIYSTDSKCIHGIYEASSWVYEDTSDIGFDDDAPYRFNVRSVFPVGLAVSEHELLTKSNASHLFRSIFHKKSLGRGKACTHLFPDETENLTRVLLRTHDSIPDENPYDKFGSVPSPLLPRFVPNSNGSLRYEKELEWWLTTNIDSNAECKKAFGNPNDITLFANYVPIAVTGSNLDFITYHEKDVLDLNELYKITLVELKKGVGDKVAFEEIRRYVLWFIQNLHDIDAYSIIQPMIIAHEFKDDMLQLCEAWNLSKRKPKLYSYVAISETEITLTEVL